MEGGILEQVITPAVAAVLAGAVSTAEVVVQAQRHARHPVSFTGQTRHAEVLKYASLGLDPAFDWKHISVGNCCFLRSPCRQVRLVVASAKYASGGVAGCRLKIKQTSRPFRAAAIETNARKAGQIALFDQLRNVLLRDEDQEDEEDPAMAVAEGEEREPWTVFLLVAQEPGRLTSEVHLIQSQPGEDGGDWITYLPIMDRRLEVADTPPPSSRPLKRPGELPPGVPPSLDVDLRHPDGKGASDDA